MNGPSCFEIGDHNRNKKCMEQPQKVLWEVLSSWFPSAFVGDLRKWHKTACRYVCKCSKTATKVDLTATVSKLKQDCMLVSS